MANLAGVDIKIVNNSISIEWVPRFDWKRLSNGNWFPFDIGFDRYYSTFNIIGTRSECESFDSALGTLGRGVSAITYGSGEMIFGPGTITPVTQVQIVKRPELRRIGYTLWGLVGLKIMPLDADGGKPTTTPNIDIMCLAQNAYEPNTSIDAAAQVSIDNTPHVTDQLVDVGYFRASFRNTDADFAAIYSAIVDARGDSIPFPDIQGITYPFGPRGPSDGGNCRIRDLSNVRRIGLEWTYDLTIVQEL